MDGWIKVHKQITEHWIWADAERLKWWLDLLMLAAWEDGKTLVGGQLVEYHRGEVLVSVRYLQDRWTSKKGRAVAIPSKKTISHFLQILENDGMIFCQKRVHQITHITICNYERYQCNSTQHGDTNGYTNGDTNGYTNGYKYKEYKEYKKDRNIDTNVSCQISAIAEIPALWNSILKNSPHVLKLTEARKKKITARVQEFGTTSDENLKEFCTRLFARVQASDFLTGRAQGTNGRGWVATFDWLFENSSNWVKVQEGNYDNDRASGNTQMPTAGVQLGVGEYFDAHGRRTYGTGTATIPADAPARPSERHAWVDETKQWTIL